MKRLAVLASLALAGCGGWQSVMVSDRARDAAKIAMLQRLKDPGTAQFGDGFSASRSGKMTLVCGSLNARNSFGGYTGFETFAVLYNEETGEASVQDSPALCGLTRSAPPNTLPASILEQHGIKTPPKPAA